MRAWLNPSKANLLKLLPSSHTYSTNVALDDGRRRNGRGPLAPMEDSVRHDHAGGRIAVPVVSVRVQQARGIRLGAISGVARFETRSGPEDKRVVNRYFLLPDPLVARLRHGFEQKWLILCSPAIVSNHTSVYVRTNAP